MGVKIKDKDRGFKKLAASLGQMGSVTIGVQGKEAKEKHPESDLSVGEIAAIHELGLGVPKRSWLVSWLDANQSRMKLETAAAMVLVMKGATTRNKALKGLGAEWVKDVKMEISSGRISPALVHPRPDGTTAPLFDTHTMHDSITAKVFLPHKKGITDPAQLDAVGGSATKKSPMSGKKFDPKKRGFFGAVKVKKPKGPKKYKGPRSKKNGFNPKKHAFFGVLTIKAPKPKKVKKPKRLKVVKVKKPRILKSRAPARTSSKSTRLRKVKWRTPPKGPRGGGLQRAIVALIRRASRAQGIGRFRSGR